MSKFSPRKRILSAGSITNWFGRQVLHKVMLLACVRRISIGRLACSATNGKKTGEWAYLKIGSRLQVLLRQLPSKGLLFPNIGKTNNSARSAEFCRRCWLLKIKGVSLHSYRYAWAERAKDCGYPERFAQQALGHGSKAVHRAYARNAKVVLSPLESFEQDAQARKIVAFPSINECSGQSAPAAPAKTA